MKAILVLAGLTAALLLGFLGGFDSAIRSDCSVSPTELVHSEEKLAEPTSTSEALGPSSTVSLLFVQESPNGELKRESDGSLVLVLNDAMPQTLYFSERPFIIVGTIPTEIFPHIFDWVIPPNAAIVPKETEEMGDILVVQLLSATYDSLTQQISYHVKAIGQLGQSLESFVDGTTEVTQVSLGATSLLIDDLDYENAMEAAANAGVQDYGCGYTELLGTAASMEQALSSEVGASGEESGIAEMFEIQLASNKFSQFSEMMSSLFQAKNAAIMSIARGLK